jgi:hypothetical protein
MTHPNVNFRGKMMTGHAELAKRALRQGRPYDDDDRRSCAITWIVRQPCALPEWVQKRPFRRARAMSEMLPIWDVRTSSPHVADVPLNETARAVERFAQGSGWG